MRQSLKRVGQFFLGFGLIIMSAQALAASGSSTDVASLVTSVQKSILIPILDVTIAIAYLAGVGFVIAGLFKLKAHKDNPQQVTIGTPIFLLGVGVALLFAPALINAAGSSVGLSTQGGLTYSGSSLTG